MPHDTSRLSLFFIITLFLSSLCLAQDDPRTLRLAERLVTAQTEDERAALLSVEKDLVTVELRKAVHARGGWHRSQGNYEEALTIYRLAQKIAEQIGDKAGVSQELNTTGYVHYLRSNYGLALEYSQKSSTLSESLDDKIGIASAQSNIGLVHLLQRNYVIALEYFHKSLAQYEAAAHKRGIAMTLNNIGVAYFSQGNHDLALEYYKKVLSQSEASGYKQGIATMLTNIGKVYRSQNNYRLALEYHQKSLTVKEALGDKDGIAETLEDIGVIYHLQGDYTQALEFAERAATISREIGIRETLWQAHTTAGRAYRALNKFTQARRSFEEAIAIIEILRSQVAGGEQEQQRFFENKLAPYHAMVGLSLAQNNVGEAFDYAERAKSRVLLDVLQSGRVNINKAMDAPEQERERELRSELVALNSQSTRENSRPQPEQAGLVNLKARLQKARLEYEAFQTSLYAAHPELKVRRGEAQPVSLDEVTALLPDAGSALVQYVVTDDKTFLFVLTRGGAKASKPIDLKVFTLDVRRKDLATRVAHFREQLARRDVRFAASARELYALLLAPAHRELEGKRTLVIVPDAALWELPFQALQPAANRFLIEDHAISYAPSLTVLREMKKARRKNPGGAPTSAATLLAFGNPTLGKQTVERVKSVMMDGELDPLPEAEKQVRALGRLYGASRSRVYIGAEAREGRVKAEAGDYRILQLATHGILNDASPMYSHVMLAYDGSDTDKSSAEDGLLEAWEIMNLDLNADLVVLSACETARGRVGAGEGVIGLTWALFVAGSPATVVSQWKVESASTTALMLEFHRRLQPTVKRPHTSTAAALQQASLKLLDSRPYRHPFYWAGFVVVGDGN